MSKCDECGCSLDGKLCYGISKTDRFCHDCYLIINADDLANDAKIDRWHNGYFAKTRPTDPDELEGWLQAREDARRPVPVFERPEGYYHMPLGTFD